MVTDNVPNVDLCVVFKSPRASRQIVTDKNILDLKVEAVAKFITKTIFFDPRGHSACNVSLS